MRRLPLFALAAVAVAFALGCGDRQPTTAPNDRFGGPRLDISDGAHDGGNDDFYFLPPMVKEPVGKPGYKDERFHGGVRPHVDIWALAVTVRPCVGGAPFKHFAPEQIQVSDEKYHVNWDTKETALVDNMVYRIQVCVGDALLGYADVKHADNRSELKNVDTDDFVPLVDGRTLPIKFRIEVGALCVFDAVCTSTFVDKDVGGTFYAADNGAAIDFSPGVLPVDVVLTIERIPVPPGGVCVAGAAVGSIVFQQWEGCYRMTTAPDIRPFGGFTGPTRENPDTRAIVAVCPEPGAPRELLLHKFDEGRPVERPEPTVPPFPFPCAGFQGTPSSGPIGFAREGLRMLAAGVSRLLGPRALYAVDGGLGCILRAGRDGALSTFFWGLPVTASAVAGTNGQEAPVGTAVEIAPAVEVVTLHADGEADGHEPVSGVPVTFTVTGGGGTLLNALGAPVSSAADTTDPAGIATLPSGWSWRLGILPGVNRLVASGPFVDTSVTFTATGRALISTSTAIVTAAPLAVVGEPVRLEATVSPAPSGSGSVEFFDGTASLGTVALFPNGTASLTVPSFSLRAHTLSASFLGNSTHAASSSATITQHTVQRYTSLAEFQAAVGGVTVQVQDFDGLADGTPITSLIGGVLAVQSPFPVLGVRTCTDSPALFGQSSETFNPRTTPTEFGFNSFYDLLFFSTSAPRTALAFDIVAQDPASQPAVLEITGISTPTARFFVSNTGSETAPVFVGMIASQPLNRVIVNEGREANNFPGNEEICLDNFRVANVSTP